MPQPGSGNHEVDVVGSDRAVASEDGRTGSSADDAATLRGVNSNALANGGTAWRTNTGSLAIWPARAGVLVVAMQGHGARAFAEPIARGYDQIPRASPVHLFFDFEHLIDYEPPLRTELVLHFFPDRQRIRATHVLVKPPAPGTMMAAAINAFRGIVDVVEDRARFEALLELRLSSEGGGDSPTSSLRAFASERQ